MNKIDYLKVFWHLILFPLLSGGISFVLLMPFFIWSLIHVNGVIIISLLLSGYSFSIMFIAYIRFGLPRIKHKKTHE